MRGVLRYSQGSVFMLNEEFEAALVSFTQAIAKLRNSGDQQTMVSLRMARARCLQKLRRWKPALDDLDQCVRTMTVKFEVFHLQGKSFFGLEKYGFARTCFTRARMALEKEAGELKQSLAQLETPMAKQQLPKEQWVEMKTMMGCRQQYIARMLQEASRWIRKCQAHQKAGKGNTQKKSPPGESKVASSPVAAQPSSTQTRSRTTQHKAPTATTEDNKGTTTKLSDTGKPSEKQAAPTTKKPEANAEQETSSSTERKTDGSNGSTLADGVEYSMRQSSAELIVVVYAKDVDADSLKVDFASPTQIQMSFTLPDGSKFEDVWDLAGEYDVDRASLAQSKYKVTITLPKMEVGVEWETLLASGCTTRAKLHGVVLPVPATAASTAIPSPYAGSSTDKWDKIVRQHEEEEAQVKPEGEDAIQHLFRDIFKKNNPDVQRAMMKSFQESGGTVLSTNWEEVSNTDYTKDRQAPDGMEFVEYPK